MTPNREAIAAAAPPHGGTGSGTTTRRASSRITLARTRAAAALTTTLVASVTIIAGCHSSAPPVAAPPQITVATPTTQQVTDYREFTGNTAATDSVTLVGRVEGYLEQIHFTDGAAVKQGDLLFTIQQTQYQAQLQQAQAQLAAQQAALVHAKTELARYTRLVKEDSAPATEVDRWQYELDSAQAAILAAQAQIELAKLNLGYTKVTAPFDGRMGRHLVDPGNVVGGAAQPTALATIDKLDPLYVYFTIAERDLLSIRAEHKGEGRAAMEKKEVPAFYGLLNEQDFPHQGRLDFAALTITSTTGTLQARAVFPNPEPAILPGLFVRVRIPSAAPHEALTVPGEAIAFDQQGEYVLVVDADGVVARRPVTTGMQLGQRIVVKDGLTTSDRVVIAGLQRAIPGRKVDAQTAPDATAAPSSATAPSVTKAEADKS
jgi:RND family efflux transporter MFP subunit